MLLNAARMQPATLITHGCYDNNRQFCCRVSCLERVSPRDAWSQSASGEPNRSSVSIDLREPHKLWLKRFRSASAFRWNLSGASLLNDTELSTVKVFIWRQSLVLRMRGTDRTRCGDVIVVCTPCVPVLCVRSGEIEEDCFKKEEDNGRLFSSFCLLFLFAKL